MQLAALPEEKTCPKCHILKSASEFSIVKWTYKGKVSYSLQSACKPCIVSHSMARQALKPHKRKTPKQCWVETTDLNHMRSPLNWNDMKGETGSWQYKEYPTCEAGHKYVGERCLPCKYSVYMKI